MEFDLFTISMKGFFSQRIEIYKEDVLMYDVRPKNIFRMTHTVYDNEGTAITTIKRKLFSFGFAHDIEDSFGKLGTVTKKPFSNSYELYARNGHYTVEGNFWSTSFNLYLNGEDIAKISRKKMRRTNAYGIALIKSESNLSALSMIVSLVLIRQARRRSNGG